MVLAHLYLVDAAIQNAWTLYRKSGRNISQLEFTRAIAQVSKSAIISKDIANAYLILDIPNNI
jgi:hypothetical protein